MRFRRSAENVRPRGRCIASREGEGTEVYSEHFTHNTLGQLESVTDTSDRTTRFAYDAAGRVNRQTLPDNRAITYSYDNKGNLAGLIPPGKEAHVFTYTRRA